MIKVQFISVVRWPDLIKVQFLSVVRRPDLMLVLNLSDCITSVLIVIYA